MRLTGKDLPGAIYAPALVSIQINKSTPRHYTVHVVTEWTDEESPVNYAGNGIAHQAAGQDFPEGTPDEFGFKGSVLIIPPPQLSELMELGPLPFFALKPEGESDILDWNVITEMGGEGHLQFGGHSRFHHGFAGSHRHIKWNPLLKS
ncbi:hypothetical protein FRB90_010671 [Tulasnella sp. 427]|nr:hypothetical protein FRB90_010671 [Tulasnella sp. 427]